MASTMRLFGRLPRRTIHSTPSALLPSSRPVNPVSPIPPTANTGTHSHPAPGSVVAGKLPDPSMGQGGNTSDSPTSGALTPSGALGALVPGGGQGQEVTAEIVSGAPAEMRLRPVRIYKPTKTTMQSAKGKTKLWLLDWDVLQGSGRWTNPLMGWASSADYVQGTTLKFRSREEAIAFAERQGYPYYVEEPSPTRIPPKNYASNYVHVPGKLRIHHTK